VGNLKAAAADDLNFEEVKVKEEKI